MPMASQPTYSLAQGRNSSVRGQRLGLGALAIRLVQ